MMIVEKGVKYISPLQIVTDVRRNMAYEWQEIVDGGRHRFTCAIKETQLTIEKSMVPGAWFCVLPNGKRVIGELRIVRRIVEKFAQVRSD